MKRAFIAAAFGGVLASGFLTVSAPAAHALPCDAATFGTQVCRDCLTAQGSIFACTSAKPSQGNGCKDASEHSGIPCNPQCPC